MAIINRPDDDDRAFMSALYEKYYRLMISRARLYFSERMDVEDVVSDTCIALYNNIATLRTLDENQAILYIINAANNTSRNALIRSKADRILNIRLSDDIVNNLPAQIDIEQKVSLRSELEFAFAQFSILTEKERIVMGLYLFGEFDYKEIAESVGLSVDSVHKYVSRARAKLKAETFVEE